jgi:hypothetical protein
MNCPIIGFPGTHRQRQYGTLFFQFPTGAITPYNANNTVAVTVSNPGDLGSPIQADAYQRCRVEFFWYSSLNMVGPIELSAYFGGYGVQYQTPTPLIGTQAASIPFNGSTLFSIGWTTAEVCYDYGTLYAQAQLDPGGGAGHDCPQSPPPNTRPTNFDQVFNAARHVTIGPCVTTRAVPMHSQPQSQPHGGGHRLDNRSYFAAGIVSTESRPVATEIHVRSVLESDRTHPEHTRISELLDAGGRWLRAKEVRVALGVERAVAHGPSIGRLGNLGVVSPDTFHRLRDGDLRRDQEFRLVGRETRQVLLEIEHAHEARPQDFYVLEVDQHDESSKDRKGGAIVVACGDWLLHDE